MVPSPSLGKLLASDRMIKAAITKRGFIWNLLIGATNGPIKLTATGTFASKNDLRILHAVKNDISVRL